MNTWDRVPQSNNISPLYGTYLQADHRLVVPAAPGATSKPQYGLAARTGRAPDLEPENACRLPDSVTSGWPVRTKPATSAVITAPAASFLPLPPRHEPRPDAACQVPPIAESISMPQPSG
jgi:hypothetical protein